MSNVIKAYSIRYEEDKKKIETHLRIDKELEGQKKKIQREERPQTENGFVEGLQALVVDPPPQTDEADQVAEQLLGQARDEAEHIISQAKKESEALKKDIIDSARDKGYEEGMRQSRAEHAKQKAEYDKKFARMKEEYDAMLLAAEPQMVEIIASFVKKITGIVIEDKSEVIYYLVHKALRNMDKSKAYIIRVSGEDYEAVSQRKKLLKEVIGREAELTVSEDAKLEKSQCLIETEQHVINCSLDVQLNNLIMDLKLLAGI